MSKTKLSILLAMVAFVSLIAFGLWTRPKVQDIDSENFSAERVVKDIEVISQEHHSVAHPAERAKVRQYLLERLQELGADTIKIFEHKNLVGPENKHVVYTFDAYNILAEFAPLHADSADNQNTSLMMVAHYDSRYSQPMPRQDTVWSYGAADDGYGVGVILETLNQALKYRSEWKQSFKILFTDAEEPGMQGMKALWREHREVFDEVGLMINVEARGPFGPALLFETSPGSKNLVKLYQQTARYPHTYSLTTVVYGFMPNFTDFTIVKDDIPGLNFSTIADINHYHTNLDNFSNIQPRSIQHYGAQIVPLVHEYLTNARYCDKDILRSDENSINFSIPLLGLLNFSKTTYTWVNILVFVCFLLILLLDIIRGRAK
ncbi:MAG: M28 family peptidase, partial [Bacteroidales bacterium]|nr:M28 family peptidase [Bacteroidales bacterium]